MQAPILLLSLLASVQAQQLWCYDCDPTSHGECSDPEGYNSKITLCDQTSSNIKNLRSLQAPSRKCFTINYTPNTGGGAGIYRGCVVHQGNQDSCDYLKSYLVKGKIEYCNACEARKCNNDAVKVVKDI